MKNLAGIILKLRGWKIVNFLPPDLKKCVVIMAPHTSNWDFVVGWLGFSALGIQSKFLIKKEAFFFPLGIILRKLGAISVDRKANNNVVMQVGEMFHRSEQLFVTITPEGTRSLNPTWKKGFYYIAEYGKVPVALGFLDFKTKTGGIGKILEISGNYDNDLKIIEDFYRGKHGKHPENFNLFP